MSTHRANVFSGIGWPLAIVLVVSTVLLFWNIGSFPPKAEYDEGFYLRVAAERLQGQTAPLALKYLTSVSPLFPFTPLYQFLLSQALGLGGLSLAVGRAFTALAALFTVGSLYFLSYRHIGKRAAFWSFIGLLGLATFWKFSRIVSPHGAAGLLIFSSFVSLTEWRRSRRLTWFFISVTLATTAPFLHYWTLWYIALFPFLLRPWKRYAWLSLLPALAIVLFWLQRWTSLGLPFIHDLQSLVQWEVQGGLLGKQPWWSHALHPVQSFIIALILQPVLLLGFIGLRCIRDRWLRNSTTLLAAVGFLYAYRDRTPDGSPYLILLVAGFFALGFGTLIDWVLTSLIPKHTPLAAQRVLKWVAGLAVIFLASLAVVSNMKNVVDPRWKNEREVATRDMTKVVEFIRTHATPDQYVPAPSVINWLLPTRSVDPIIAYARDHGSFQGVVGKKYFVRWETDDASFAYATSIPSARYVVYLKEYRSPALAYGDFGFIYRDLDQQITGWPIAMETSLYTIYENPVRLK